MPRASPFTQPFRRGVSEQAGRVSRVFPGAGEPRNIFEKLEDCSTINQLVRATPAVSLHIPWDKPDDARELRDYAGSLGLGFDAMNSNTFQDQAGQKLSYKFGSLTHTDRAVREQAIDHNIECIEIGKRARLKSPHCLDRRRRKLPRAAAFSPGSRALSR